MQCSAPVRQNAQATQLTHRARRGSPPAPTPLPPPCTGPRSPEARGGRGPAAEEDEEVGVEEGDAPEDGHAPELRRADHAERLAVHGGRSVTVDSIHQRSTVTKLLCTDHR